TLGGVKPPSLSAERPCPDIVWGGNSTAAPRKKSYPGSEPFEPGREKDHPGRRIPPPKPLLGNQTGGRSRGESPRQWSRTNAALRPTASIDQTYSRTRHLAIFPLVAELATPLPDTNAIPRYAPILQSGPFRAD